MGLSLRAGIASDVGEYRETNQDAAFAASWGAGVADGVGGDAESVAEAAAPGGDVVGGDAVEPDVGGDDRAAVHDMILDPKRARHRTGNGTTDDVGRDDLQGTRRSQGNGTFGDAEKSHE